MSVTIERPQTIQTMIDGVERYNPDNAEVLEDYLATQCKNGDYDLMANLALLKLYQFNPQLTKKSVIVNVLGKALTAIPNPDFNLCMYLLADHIDDADVQSMIQLQQLLEQARYVEFWKVFNEQKYRSLVKDIVGFDGAIRSVIAKVVTMSYQTIAASVLQAYAGLEGSAFEVFCKENQWTLDNGVVTVPINKDNEAKTVVVRENIKFEQLTKIIGFSNEM